MENKKEIIKIKRMIDVLKNKEFMSCDSYKKRIRVVMKRFFWRKGTNNESWGKEEKKREKKFIIDF